LGVGSNSPTIQIKLKPCPDLDISGTEVHQSYLL
jgi:hypothetical protein